MEELSADSNDGAPAGGDVDSRVEGQVYPRLVLKATNEAKLKELLHNICSFEIKLCSHATKEFIKLLKWETGGELLHLYVRSSPKFTELLEAWKLRAGKPGMHHVLLLASTILSHPDGTFESNYKEVISVIRAIDSFARFIIAEKLVDIYKELSSKEGKRQNAALLLLTSIVRRGSALASDVAKKFDFKIQGISKMAEHKTKKVNKTRKQSTRKAFVRFAMSFLEVGKPGLLRWILQQKEMYSGVLRGLANDDDEIVIHILETLRDRILTDKSSVPPGLRSVLFGSVTLEQLVSVSAREEGGHAAELAHQTLIMVCTDPCNGLMPDLKRSPNPLRGNPKRLLALMRKLRAAEIGYHRDLLMAIARGRPSLNSEFLDDFPYNLEDYASPTWFSSVSLAANLLFSLGASYPFDFLNTSSCDTPSIESADVHEIMKCICPRPFSRSMFNKGLLHPDFLVKHGTLRLLLGALKVLECFILAVNQCSSLSHQGMGRRESVRKDIQNEARNLLPDFQVLLTQLSSLSGHKNTQKSHLKRKSEVEKGVTESYKRIKKSKVDIMNEDADIIIGGIRCGPDIFPQEYSEKLESVDVAKDLEIKKEFLDVVTEIWTSDECTLVVSSLEDAEIIFHTKLLDALRIYLRTVHNNSEGSFEFFFNLLSDPLALPVGLLRSLLSLLNEYVGWSSASSRSKSPIRTPTLMYKHLYPFISLLILSPFDDIKDLAYDLAQAAMLSTGAFDRIPHEICAWFLFLPGHGRTKRPAEVVEAEQNLAVVVISFLCDAVSTVGNNLFKYWDIVRNHTLQMKGSKVAAASLDFSPLVVCVLQKCLRLLSSESKTYSLSEKSMISLYVGNTLKHLLQTQVDAKLLSGLVQSILFDTVDNTCDSALEWRPMKNLKLFSKAISHPAAGCLLFGELKSVNNDGSFAKTLLPGGTKPVDTSDGSFARALKEVKKLINAAHQNEVAGIVKAFISTMLCTTPDVLLENFSPVLTIFWNRLGIPLPLLWPLVLIEHKFFEHLFKLQPDKIFHGFEMVESLIHHGEAEDVAAVAPDCSFLATGTTYDSDSDKLEPFTSAFSLFIKDAPFHVLFPVLMSADISCLIETSKLKNLLLVKISECRSDFNIFYLRLILFWLHQIRSSYKVQQVCLLSKLSEICLLLVQQLLSQAFMCSAETSGSRWVSLSAENKQELAWTVFSHPFVVASIEHPLNPNDWLVVQNLEISLDALITLSRQKLNKMDHRVLDLLTSACEIFVCDGQVSFQNMSGGNRLIMKAFSTLLGRILLKFKKGLEFFLRTKDLIPLLQRFSAVNSLIPFISPFKLLELAISILCRVDVKKPCEILSVGLCITSSGFENLSTYLNQPGTSRKVYDLFWGMEGTAYDSKLIEEAYALACKFATCLESEIADACLLKAVNIVYRQKYHGNCEVHPLTLTMSQIVVRTPLELIHQCVCRPSMIRAKLLLYLNELSPLHLSVFGNLFLCVLNKKPFVEDNIMEGACLSSLSDKEFILLLPAALSFLNSVSGKYEMKHHKHFMAITTLYSRIILEGFLDWQSFVTGKLFEEEYEGFVASSAEDLENIVRDSLLGKAILMLQYHFSLSGKLAKMEKLLELFDSIFQCFASHDELLDPNANEIDSDSYNRLLNIVIRIVAKVLFFKAVLFPEEVKFPYLTNEANKRVKDGHLGTGFARGDLLKRLMNILVDIWQWLVRKLALVSDGSSVRQKAQHLGLYKCLEDFILKNILVLTKVMRKDLVELKSIPIFDKLMKSSLLYRFEDPSTLKRVRIIMSLLSDGKFSFLPYLQLLLSHSQFAQTIRSPATSSTSPAGEFFKPMSSFLRSLRMSRNDSGGHGAVTDANAARHAYGQKLEIVKLLRVLLKSKPRQWSSDTSDGIGINLKELHSLLLSSYGATLSRIDLEIKRLMDEIELIDESLIANVAETNYLWGTAAAKLRQQWSLERGESHGVLNADRRSQFRENLCVGPRLCASTVLWFPYQRTVTCAPTSGNSFQCEGGEDTEEAISCFEIMPQYDPSFILNFALHCLSLGYLEPGEFAGLGLLAIAFVSMSSADIALRKLAYETLGRFRASLEYCRTGKDVVRLKLLLTYVQNGIDEPWQKVPSLSALFAAEMSVILLDPSHEHCSTLSKLLMRSSKVNLKGLPVFNTFFWSSSVDFRPQRIWLLRLLCAGLNSDDDAQIFIRQSITEMLLSFYSSNLADNESKDLILQVLRKAVKLHKLTKYLVEHCGLFTWVSSVISNIGGKLLGDGKSFSLAQLVTVVEVVNGALSSRNVVEWLQRTALEQLMGISSNLYRLVVVGLISINENGSLSELILQIILSTLRISQKRKVYQPHFTLSLEGVLRIHQAVCPCNTSMVSSSVELGLRAILMSTPPVDILCMDKEKLSGFLLWGASTAMMSDFKQQQQENGCHQDNKMVTEDALSEESLVSKFLRWLVAAVILGSFHAKADGLDAKILGRKNSETLQSLCNFIDLGYREEVERFEAGEIIAAEICYLQQHLGINCRFLASVVCALYLLLPLSGSGSPGLGFLDKTFREELFSKIRFPPEGNPTWRWSYYQPWRDLSSEPATNIEQIEELRACQTLLRVFCCLLGENTSCSLPSWSNVLETWRATQWERYIVERDE